MELLRAGGQSVITTTELAHVPGADDADVVRLAIVDGAVHAARAPAMRRRSPAALSAWRSSALADGVMPATLLAEVQRVWPEAAGAALAARPGAGLGARRSGHRACGSAVWAQELDLLSERVIERLNERARPRRP